MNSAIAPSVRIRRLWVEDYKGIDHIELAFPPPLLPGDPDIVVMGSRNGLGKTSVLECCALLLIGLTRGEYLFEFERNRYLPMDLPQLMIRAGASLATIGGELVIGGEAI